MDSGYVHFWASGDKSLCNRFCTGSLESPAEKAVFCKQLCDSPSTPHCKSCYRMRLKFPLVSMVEVEEDFTEGVSEGDEVFESELDPAEDE